MKNGTFANGAKFKMLSNGQREDTDGFRTSRWTKRVLIGYTCVSVKITDDSVLVRSTQDPSKTTVQFTKNEWATFVKGVKNNEFDVV